MIATWRCTFHPVNAGPLVVLARPQHHPGRPAQVNLRVTVEGFGARGVAARQGLVPLRGQGPMVDAVGVAVPLQHSVSPFNSVNEIFPQ